MWGGAPSSAQGLNAEDPAHIGRQGEATEHPVVAPYFLCTASVASETGKSGSAGMAQCPLSLDGLGGVATGAARCVNL